MATPAQIAANRENAKKAGRKKGIKANHTIEAISAKALLIRMFEEKKQPIFEALINKAADGDLGAIKELADRVWGRASQSVELTGKDGAQLIPKSDVDIQAIATEVAARLKEKKTTDLSTPQ